MHTELKIKTPKNGKGRAYIEFYFNEKRYREYTGRNIGLDIEPNKETSPEKRLELLYDLKSALHLQLKNGAYPLPNKSVENDKRSETLSFKQYTIKESLNLALDKKKKLKLSTRYITDLDDVCSQFLKSLEESNQNAPFSHLTIETIEQFLMKHASSSTYYMKKRSDLAILLTTAAKINGCRCIARDTQTMKGKAVLHKAYSKPQLKAILNYLKVKDKELFLCCLLTYACWLRPHVEILSLTKRDFKAKNTEIHLAGNQNKSGKIRIVYVPEYVRTELDPLLDQLDLDCNLFSKTPIKLNRFYFTTKWKRLKNEIKKLKLIEEDQTIYSFRHTAAVEIYNKTKDIYLIQRLMGHSSIMVTQRYLRSLGQVDITDFINHTPTL